MAVREIRKRFEPGGVLADPFSVKLSDPNGLFGVRRTDTGAVVVSDGTALVRQSTGIWAYQVTEPAPGLTYEYWVEVVWNEGETPSYFEDGWTGSADGGSNLYELLPQMQHRLPGCSVPVMEQALRQMARIFLNETRLWTEQVEFEVDAAATDYDLVLPSGTELVEVAWVRAGEAPVPEPMRATWGQGVNYRTSIQYGSIVLDSAVTDEDLVLAAGLVLLPRLTLAALPQYILDQWGHCVAEGAVWNCMAMPGKPWSVAKPELEAQYRVWMGLVAEAKIAQVRGAENAPVQVQLRSWV